MTRIWYVPFGELDDKRILGQHREVHIIAGVIAAGKRWKGFSVPQLVAVHRASLVEMKKRGFPSGFLHDTNIEQQVGPEEGQEVLKWPGDASQYQSEQEADRWDLLCRWGGVYKGRIAMPSVYEPLLQRYAAEGGCTHAGRTARLADGTVQCLICKQAILVSGQWISVPWRE